MIIIIYVKSFLLLLMLWSDFEGLQGITVSYTHTKFKEKQMNYLNLKRTGCILEVLNLAKH